MSETFGDGRVNGFAPGGDAPPLLSDEEAAGLAKIAQMKGANRQALRGLAGGLLVSVALSAIVATVLVYLQASHQNEAIATYYKMATSCSTGSRYAYARRYQEFDDAVDRLDRGDPLREDLHARHLNLILLRRCQ
jgi:hypothetical protein